MEQNQSGYGALRQDIAKRNQKDVSWFPKKKDEMRLVRVPVCENAHEKYLSHSYFDENITVPPFACIKEQDANAEDAFDKAVAYLESRTRPRKEQGLYGKNNQDPEYVIEKRLRAKIRRMFGFYNLDDGEPFVIHLSEQQADDLAKELMAKQKYFGTHAFELKKKDKGFSIQPSLEDLSQEQKHHFEACNEPFDHSIFASALFFRSEEKQVEDLHKIGLDVTQFGYTTPTASSIGSVPSQATNDAPVTVADSDLPVEEATEKPFISQETQAHKEDVYSSREMEEIMGESETA